MSESKAEEAETDSGKAATDKAATDAPLTVAEVTQSCGAVDFGDRKGVVSGDVGAGGVLRGNLDCPVS